MIIGIYCSGGFGREMYDLAHLINNKNRHWSDIVFVDDVTEAENANGGVIYRFETFKQKFPPSIAKITIAIGEPKHRRMLADKVISDGYALESLIHPDVKIGTGTRIGEGTIIAYYPYITCNLTIGRNVIIHPFASIGHDIIIGDDCVIGPNVSVGGRTVIGDRTYLGMNAAVKEKLKIGSDVIIAMAAAVFRDLPDNVTAVGNPARISKMNNEGLVFK